MNWSALAVPESSTFFEGRPKKVSFSKIPIFEIFTSCHNVILSCVCIIRVDETLRRRDFVVGGLSVVAAGPMFASESYGRITGAGTSAAAPAYWAWTRGFSSTSGEEIGFLPVGSKLGREMLISGEVDFAGLDQPLSRLDLDTHGLRQFQTVHVPVVPVVNLGIRSGSLRLTRELLRGLFSGGVRIWNEGPIADLNPDMRLPNLAITPLIRPEASGIRNDFAAYLSPGRLGLGSFNFANYTGLVLNGSRATRLTLARLRGSIGLLEYSAQRRLGLPVVQIEGLRGGFVLPGSSSFARAADRQDERGVEDLSFPTWPLMSTIYSVFRRSDSLPVLRDYFDHVFQNGDEVALGAGYFPLGRESKAKARAIWQGGLG